jgi:hypothetical protein
MHLTNNEPIRNDALAAPDRLDAAGAPAREIEITQEMIDAGYDALFDDPRFPEGGRVSICNALTLAFRAMLRVHQAQFFGRFVRDPVIL